jgi:hypothetical protein
MQIEIIISLVGTIGTILTVVMIYFGKISSMDRRLTASISSVDKRVEGMRIKTDLLWGVVEKEIPRLLKNPGDSYKDKLLDKMSREGLTINEAIELRQLLKKEIKNKDGAAVIAYALILVKLEYIIGGT